jgi:antitoxin component YwqK of YwqJK toxin-antitoxin module
MKKLVWFILAVSAIACANDAEKKAKSETKNKTQVKEEVYKVSIPASNKAKDSIPENGEYVSKYENGQVEIQGMMKNGKREGLWKSFYEDGTPWSQTTFKEGKKEGPTTTWYENGKKRYEGFYKNDLESGVWKYYDEKENFIKNFDYDKQQ